MIFHIQFFLASFLINIFIFFLFFIFFIYLIKKETKSSQHVLSYISKTAYNFGGLGICSFDKNYKILWVNDLINQRNSKSLIGVSIFKWLPRIQELITNPNIKLKITMDKRIYNVRIFREISIIFLIDVTDYESIINQIDKEGIVMGSMKIENLQRTLSTKDEKYQIKLTSEINFQIIEWCDKYNIFIKKINVDDYIILMNKISLDIISSSDRFSIIDKVKDISKKLSANISLSIGISYGISDPNASFPIANSNLSKAISRGGGQAIVRKFGKNKQYTFGANSEFIDVNSSLDIKFFSNTLLNKIKNSKKIIISGHKFGDYDSIGSSLGIYLLTKYFNKPAKIVIDFSLLDKNAQDNLKNYLSKELIKEIYITPQKANKLFDKDETLIIVCDTHVKYRAEVSDIIEKKSPHNMVVIDHHRLNEKSIIDVGEHYIKPSMSSTSEIVTEIIHNICPNYRKPQYVIDLLLTGIILDTNNFKTRCTQYTFESVAKLREWGANPMVARELLKDDYETTIIKNNILKSATEILPGFLCSIAPENHKIPRSIIAQVAQELAEIKNIDAGFVIAKDDKGMTSLSARTNNKINVQIIAESMGGGGHFNASATQSTTLSTQEMKELLITNLNKLSMKYTLPKEE